MRDRASREGEMRELGYWRRVGEDIWHELPGLLGANALLLVWCTPTVALAMMGLPVLATLVAPLTLGAGLAGLGTYTGRLAREQGGRWWRDSVAGARARSAACAVLVTLGLGATVLPAMALRLMTAHGTTAMTVAALTGQTVIAVCLVVMCAHGWGLVALYGQPTGVALRNAAVLTISHPLSSAGPFGLGLLFFHVAQLFGWGPLVVLPAILALCAVHHTRRLAEHRVISLEPSQETTCPLR
jgi:hypothetical protein